jgi:hypothetical protein
MPCTAALSDWIRKRGPKRFQSTVSSRELRVPSEVAGVVGYHFQRTELYASALPDLREADSQLFAIDCGLSGLFRTGAK